MSDNYSHWSRYWARGCLTSLPQDFSANYDGEVAAFWRSQFELLQPGAKLLDVCTGNGALALLAAAWSHESDMRFSITGVDAARIDAEAVRRAHPDAASRMDDIRFIDDTPYEHADLPAASFDLVMSQYGIEYCDWQAAAAQSERLLRPGARLAFVAHTPTSDMIETMRRESDEFSVLDELRALGVLRRFASGEIQAGEYRSEFNRIGPELFGRYKQSGSGLFRYVLTMADQTLGLNDSALQQQRPAIDAAVRELSAARQRLLDMLGVNERISRHPDWTGAFEDAGLTGVESGELHYRGSHRVGTFHVFEKPRRT
ncbi:class I SAM-dependent methyltransferase [Wenzhouxiangella sediminis]|uniref:Class I SAM-dependent methyltransferase n=1 Tax=Wenzhouxiangella sediminis TaxID=1792836 RepID=A0A3E1K926_9GAMM|nr:class I SAM-dependent methyltransferase [Wenzhouxiangella sediminis]RFF30610.1 class I SAM-dependent methyltransferase [Wenzhouxiangella sediminis]